MEKAYFAGENENQYANTFAAPDKATVTLECGVSFTLCDAVADDLETLWQIDQKCFSPLIAYSRDELRLFMRRRGSFTIVAVNDDNHKIGGFIIGHAGPTGHIITIDVEAGARRSGLGSQLLMAAEERLRSAGKRTVTLETAVDNHGALSFYNRHSYEVVETITGYYSDGADAFLLRKSLAAGLV